MDNTIIVKLIPRINDLRKRNVIDSIDKSILCRGTMAYKKNSDEDDYMNIVKLIENKHKNDKEVLVMCETIRSLIEKEEQK